MNSSKVLSNSFWILSASAFNKVSSIVLLVVLTRYLGTDGFGTFSFVFFYVMFFSSVTEIGLTPILIRHVNADGAGAGGVQARGISIGLAATFLTIVMSWAGTYVLGLAPGIRHLILIASVSLLISFRDITFRWIIEVPFRARLKMVYPAVLGILSEFLGLVLVLAAVYKGGSLELIIALYVLSNLPGFIALVYLSFRELRPRFSGGGVGASGLIGEALPIGASNIMMTVYMAVGSLVLFKYAGAEEVGYYALAFRLTISLRIIPEAMMHSLFPLIAEAHLEGASRVGAIFDRAVRYGALIAFPLALGTMVVSSSVATLIGGDGFASAARAISILIWATFFGFFNTILRFTFNAITLQRFNFWIYLVMLAATAALSFALIPRYGFVGACYALVFSEALGLIIGLAIAKSFELSIRARLMVKYLISSLVMAILIWFLPQLILQVLIGIIVYVAICLILGGIEKEELFKWVRFRPGQRS
jgi:O-antigen/teichoic acid export membrane protein